jgi:hypothetical protein
VALTCIIISSGQPTANPRLVKEALALAEAGYSIVVLYCPLSPWADLYDNQLFAKNNHISWIRVGWHPVKQKWQYLLARFRSKVYQLIWLLFGNVKDAALRSMVLYSQELESEALKHRGCLYIGHNLGALSAVVKASKKLDAKASFDFEDFHRGETQSNSTNSLKVKQIEDAYVSLLDSYSAASPLILETYKNIYFSKFAQTINNCFPRMYACERIKELPIRPLKLFWFSQFVGKKRGLESVIKAMGKLKNNLITLTLLGNISFEIRAYLLSLADYWGLSQSQLIFQDVVPEPEIVNVASLHHIGLATEVTDLPSRDLCLTNKIFMYMLSGNAILFSKTTAQVHFLSQNKGIGLVFKSDDDLVDILKGYIDNPQLLFSHRLTSLKIALENKNWDEEKKILVKYVNNILHV